jgi:tetratricopeptide (TPR) repeat protein
MLAKFLSRWLLVFVLIFNASLLTACIWDSDTRSMEEKAFPDALALITGGFLRHSPEFYEWRIEQRLAEIEKSPDKMELYDDLAVAYEKTGQTAKAIEVMEGMESRDPDRYETLANLGTFYIHNGELERGLEYIDKAIAINPDAHFGRERYQKYVVEYVLSKQVEGELTLPLDGESRREGYGDAVGFTQFLFSQLSIETPEKSDSEDSELKNKQDAEVKKAIKGVLGMMRFGNHDSPILLECLGDLFFHGEKSDSNRHLASRAFLKASYGDEDEEVKEKYRNMAMYAGSAIYSPRDQSPLEFNEVEERFEEELKSADKWVTEVFENELKWIAEGINVERKYAEVYYDDPEPVADEEAEFAKLVSGPTLMLWMAGFTILGIVLVILFFIGYAIKVICSEESVAHLSKNDVGPEENI